MQEGGRAGSRAACAPGPGPGDRGGRRAVRRRGIDKLTRRGGGSVSSLSGAGHSTVGPGRGVSRVPSSHPNGRCGTTSQQRARTLTPVGRRTGDLPPTGLCAQVREFDRSSAQWLAREARKYGSPGKPGDTQRGCPSQGCDNPEPNRSGLRRTGSALHWPARKRSALGVLASLDPARGGDNPHLLLLLHWDEKGERDVLALVHVLQNLLSLTRDRGLATWPKAGSK